MYFNILRRDLKFRVYKLWGTDKVLSVKFQLLVMNRTILEVDLQNFAIGFFGPRTIPKKKTYVVKISSGCYFTNMLNKSLFIFRWDEILVKYYEERVTLLVYSTVPSGNKRY